MQHNFAQSLARSHEAEYFPFWLETYRKAFPNMQVMVNHRQDGDHQRLGIDRSIILENSKQITIDEKVRFTDYGKSDIALEYLSSYEANAPGWVCKPLLCDYIAYAVAPIGKCYLLPVEQLQTAWQENKSKWLSDCFIAKAPNKFNGRTWTTLSCCVPMSQVFLEIGKALRIDFTPYRDGTEPKKQLSPLHVKQKEIEGGIS